MKTLTMTHHLILSDGRKQMTKWTINAIAQNGINGHMSIMTVNHQHYRVVKILSFNDYEKRPGKATQAMKKCC